MRTVEWDFRRRVIEGRGLPGDVRVTCRTVVRELCIHVIRLLCLIEVRLMTLPAIDVGDVVIAIDVAGFAGLCLMRPFERKFRFRVIEGRGLPGHIRVACSAVVIKLRIRMVRLLRLVVILFVTLPAVYVIQLVVSVDVAGLTGLQLMGAFKREFCVRMIEGRRFPSVHGVAGKTITVIPPSRVIRVFRIIEVVFMAGKALEGRSRKAHSDMTVGTEHCTMPAEQREARLVVIDIVRHSFDRLPCIGIVAVLTLLSESYQLMIRLGCAVVILYMTALTLQCESRILSVYMTGLTDSTLMSACKSEIREIMIKFGRTPGSKLMAAFAVMRELRVRMIRERDGVVIRLMAGPAVRGQLRQAMNMTRDTRRGGMGATKRELGGAVVKIPFPSPAPRVVALRTIAVESACYMVRLLRFLIILLVTGVAFRRGIHILMFCLINMAGLTVRHGMRTDERKASQLMSCDRLIRRTPAGWSVAIAAAVSEFSFVLILMTGGAVDFQFRERSPGMACSAGNGSVISREGISGKLMIEGDFLFQIMPRTCGVTLHTIDTECSMSLIR
jgi:hypothetical protein